MKKLRITLRSDLCAGSGESFGNSVDTDICISDAGLPYIPARRLKGCLRAEAVQLKKYGSKLATDENIQRLFGGKNGFEGILPGPAAWRAFFLMCEVRRRCKRGCLWMVFCVIPAY